MHLLKEYISLLLNEGRPSFNLSFLKSLKTIEEVRKYANNFPNIGTGSSRQVHLISNSRVLKTAKLKDPGLTRGISQNQTEVRIATSPQVDDVIAKIYDYDSDYKWIISELVRPISEEEFKSAFNSQNNLSSLIHYYQIDGKELFSNKLQNPKLVRFVEKIVNLNKKTQLQLWDIDSEVIGKTAQGKYVLFDYGIDVENERLYMLNNPSRTKT